jgi:[ribosomal protein S5]-alanine N-acetyltransferase
MSHKVRIETERLVLREIIGSDFEAIHEYATDSKVFRFMSFGPNTPGETRTFISECDTHRMAIPRHQYHFAITVKGDDSLIGVCGLNESDGNAEIGYVLNRASWDRGYMTEAVHAVLEYGFSTITLHRIYAFCDVNNSGSYHVMEKCGMRREGRREEAVMMHGTWRTIYDYAILRREWLDMQADK